MTINKYIYNIREIIYRMIRICPDYLKDWLLELYLKIQKIKLNNLKTPLGLILYVTNQCNARCSHCFYWQELNNFEDELNLEQIKKIACSLKHPLNTLSLTGGEPFLRDDVSEICSLFVKYNSTKKINITSNGFFTEKIVSSVENILKSNSKLDLNVQISLDALKEMHNNIRGIGIFEKAVNTIKKLAILQSQNPNFHITIQTTVSKTNLSQLKELKIFTQKEFPIVHHGVQFIRSARFDTYSISNQILEDFNPKESENALLTVDLMEKVLEDGFFVEEKTNRLLNNFVRVMNEGIIDIKKNQRRFAKCLAGLYDGVVYANGKVSMCEFTKPFANLKDFDFDFYKLWNSNSANLRRKEIISCFCTHTCNLMNAMRYDKQALRKVINLNGYCAPSERSRIK